MTQSPKVRCKPYFKLRSQVRRRSARLAAQAAPQITWTVPNLCSAYNWPTGLGGGGVIALVELGGGWVQPDIDAFFQALGQPSPSVTDVSVDGTQNSPNQGVGSSNDADVEVALDIQLSGASYFAATGQAATIRVYWSQDIASAVNQAAQDGCDVCSISWGADEALWGAQAADEMESAASTATDEGMIVFAASGDNDSGDGGSTPANVDVPSSCPHVIGCGGTSKTQTAEVVWNDNPGETHGEGTGGGYSTIFPAQSWQIGAPAPPTGTTAGTGRMVPDVSADADPDTGYEMYVHGATTVVGGTSAVAPLFAGLFAAFGTKLGFVTPTLWQNRAAFNDITQGGNGFYDAGPGPDACSGIGSPIGARIAGLFRGVSGHDPNAQVR
ncbi:MAG TPA: S53 family peptidase [Terracidiphilus sp.]|jgi:kumamolisin|nr:S53 family peptidase [Terracidiphilus sp.]